MNHALIVEKLQRLLSDDLSTLDQLKQSLANEQEALKTRDLLVLKTATQQKQDLTQQLRERAKLKAKLLQSSGKAVKPGEAGKFIQSLGIPHLSALHQSVQDKLDQCQQANLVNGRVIQRSQQRSDKLMSIIRGQGQSQQLYGKYGDEHSISSARSIAQA